MSIARVFFASTAGTMTNVVFCALEPTLSLRLDDYDGLTQIDDGLIFGIQPFMYIIATLLTPYLFPKWLEVRLTIIFCSLILGLSVFLIGPAYSEEGFASMLSGLFISGFCIGPLTIVNMGEMMQATRQKHPKIDLDYTYSMLSGLFNFSLALGQVLGPIIGSLIY